MLETVVKVISENLRADDTVKEADAALYRAKEGGKNGVELYDDRSYE